MPEEQKVLAPPDMQARVDYVAQKAWFPCDSRRLICSGSDDDDVIEATGLLCDVNDTCEQSVHH